MILSKICAYQQFNIETKTSFYNKRFLLKCVGNGGELFVECERNRIILLLQAFLSDTRPALC
jgi:hypothetical protein